jgi:AraC family transcriptional regulator, regulatory protein of adaptative response / methylated-DNA-[protein]-cysteine methyltransferase
MLSMGTEQEKNNVAYYAAIVNRDTTMDGTFYYAVRTTGVYCRPSCGARLPRPENVVFYTTADQAEQAGFRACKRCRPNEIASDAHTPKIIVACETIRNAETIPTLESLARQAGMSPFYFQRVFKKHVGLTPSAYARAQRAGRVREKLGEAQTVTESFYAAGYASSGRFYRESQAVLGMKPAHFRKGGVGECITFAVGETASLGSVLVASSLQGVCAILLGDDPELLVRDLQDRFPRAEIVGGDAEYEQTIARVIGFLESPKDPLDLPLDIRGTAFQQRVWNALTTIPSGTTSTYTEIATRIGSPKAVRAVAGACAANSLAVAIPCHRVIRHDGNLSGYRWGIERKQTLLDREI